MSDLSEKQIPIEKARELQGNWIKNQGRAIKEVLGIEDVRDFTFDLEELQEFINQVREKSVSNEVVKPGIRIFFGAYPEDKKGQATIFLAAAKINSSMEIEGAPEEVENEYGIMPLNTVIGGHPPTNF